MPGKDRLYCKSSLGFHNESLNVQQKIQTRCESNIKCLDELQTYEVARQILERKIFKHENQPTQKQNNLSVVTACISIITTVSAYVAPMKMSYSSLLPICSFSMAAISPIITTIYSFASSKITTFFSKSTYSILIMVVSTIISFQTFALTSTLIDTYSCVYHTTVLYSSPYCFLYKLYLFFFLPIYETYS